jgi:rod shape determining protein RodA
MSRYLSPRDIDWTLFFIVLIISGVGIVQIWSATLDTPVHNAWWRQLVYVAGGIVLMWLILMVDYHTLTNHLPFLYVASVILLLVTYLFGAAAFGSRRWIPVGGGLHIQVSEFVKLVIILLVARYLTELRSDELYIAVLVVGAFRGGLNWKYVATVAVVGVLVLPIGYRFLPAYQKSRLISFMDPDQDPQGAGYQLIQSQIAIGSGGMAGKGITKGTQTRLRFLPVPYKDFIFSAWAEEQGFVGVVVMLSLYFVLLMRIV